MEACSLLRSATMRATCHAVPMIVCALSGCALVHGRDGECSIDPGFVCCTTGGARSPVRTGSCPFRCPSGSGLVPSASCVEDRDSGVPPFDATRPIPLECAPQRADSSCVGPVYAGAAFELPVTFESCGCCPTVECAVGVDAIARTLRLSTGLCPDPCDCDGCYLPAVACPIPALDAGTWNVVVNGAHAFDLPVVHPGEPASAACFDYAEPDVCGGSESVSPGAHSLSRLCTASAPDGSPRLTIGYDCFACTSREDVCAATLVPRFTDDLPPGGELLLEPRVYVTRCLISCDDECAPRERTCVVPALVPGQLYRVWVEGNVVLSFTAGDPPSCITL